MRSTEEAIAQARATRTVAIVHPAAAINRKIAARDQIDREDPARETVAAARNNGAKGLNAADHETAVRNATVPRLRLHRCPRSTALLCPTIEALNRWPGKSR
jgi:hypothetical protein